MKRRGRLLFYASCALVLGGSSTALAPVPIPAETQNVVPLDGAWRFKLEQAPKPPWVLKQMGPLIPIKYLPTFEPFYTTEYREDTNWHGITVPGNWEIAGFSPATKCVPFAGLDKTAVTSIPVSVSGGSAACFPGAP